MSAKPLILESLSDKELTELAWGQATLTIALAERLEMLAREREDLLRNFNQLENEDEQH